MSFTTNDVLGANPGLQEPRLQQWIHRGHLSLSNPSPGSGRTRHWSLNEIVQVATMHELTRIGFSARAAAAVGLYVRQFIDEADDQDLQDSSGQRYLSVWRGDGEGDCDNLIMFGPVDTASEALGNMDNLIEPHPARVTLDLKHLYSRVIRLLARAD